MLTTQLRELGVEADRQPLFVGDCKHAVCVTKWVTGISSPFLEFINASANITIAEAAVVVKLQKRAHNPLLVAAGFDKMGIAVPWSGGKLLRFVFDLPHTCTLAERGVKSKTNTLLSVYVCIRPDSFVSRFPSREFPGEP
jgi:hypothetical protein